MRYLNIMVAGHELALPVLEVMGIVARPRLESVPGLPDGVRGVTLFRDRVVPVIDTTHYLWQEVHEYGDRLCAVIVEVFAGKEITCHGHLDCSVTKCPAYGSSDRRCWLFSGTFCRNSVQGSHYDKIEACRACSYYQLMHREALHPVGLLFDGTAEILDGDLEQPPEFPGEARTARISLLGLCRSGETTVPVIDTQTLCRPFAGGAVA